MSFESFIATAAARKLAFVTFGWYMEERYKKLFRLSWERKHGEKNLVEADWIKIFKNSKNVPQDIYISAGDLYLMSPLLEEVSKLPECRSCIKNIYIKRISDDLYSYLTEGDKNFLPVINESLKNQYTYNLNILKNIYDEKNINEQEWPRLPSYSGTLYGEYIHYHPWEVDIDGKLTHRTTTYFMKRENDPELFGKYEGLIKSGF